MRVSQSLPAAALALLAQLRLSAATPVALEDSQIEKRCANPCGYNGWLCCGASQTCSTNNAGEAVCLDGGGGGGGGEWKYYTTTYATTETDVTTITSVWSSQVPGATPTDSCKPMYGETPCGGDCCDASSVCVNGQCVVGSSSAAGGGGPATQTVTQTGTDETEAPSPTATATPPVRGTSNGFSTVTETGAPTTTQGFIAPVGTDGSTMVGVSASGGGGGLSGGAIAGIVIGVIAGIFLLFLFCACLCCRGVIDCLLAALGCGHRRKHSDRHSSHSDQHGGWFGTRPPRHEGSENKKSGMGFWAKIAIVVGAIALCLGLKRRRDRDDDDEKSDYTYPSSYYYYPSDYYSNSDPSMCAPSLSMSVGGLTVKQAAPAPIDAREGPGIQDDRGVPGIADTNPR